MQKAEIKRLSKYWSIKQLKHTLKKCLALTQRPTKRTPIPVLSPIKCTPTPAPRRVINALISAARPTSINTNDLAKKVKWQKTDI